MVLISTTKMSFMKVNGTVIIEVVGGDSTTVMDQSMRENGSETREVEKDSLS